MSDDPKQGGFTHVEDIMSSFNDLFGQFFGQPANAGPDIRLGLAITEAVAAAGDKREIAYKYRVACVPCAGRGSQDPASPDRAASRSDAEVRSDPGAVRIACKGCGGLGTKQLAQGFFVVQTVCPDCRGAKDNIASPCGACAGVGSTMSEAKLVVVVPPGIANRTTLRIAERGNADLDGKRGDLMVTVHVGELPVPANLEDMFGPPQPQIPRAVARDPQSMRAAANERKQWILIFAAMFAVAVIGYLLLK